MELLIDVYIQFPEVLHWNASGFIPSNRCTAIGIHFSNPNSNRFLLLIFLIKKNMLLQEMQCYMCFNALSLSSLSISSLVLL